MHEFRYVQVTPAQLTANLASLTHGPYADTSISAAAGRIADDHCRPAAQLSASMRATISQATDHADALAGTLSAAHYLALTLNTADPAAPAA